MPVSQAAVARSGASTWCAGIPTVRRAGGPHPGGAMPMYLTRFSYTPETWKRLIANPEDRRNAATAYVESVGGKLHGFWYAFGAHDGVTLWEAPDNVSMSSVVLAIGSGGGGDRLYADG